MAKKKVVKKELSPAQKVGIGVGITAAALTAAGVYFLQGSKNAPKNRKRVKSWMLKAKGEVLETLEKAEEMTKEEYEEVVEKVMAAYSNLQEATGVDIKELKRELKEHWPKIEKEAKTPKKAAKKATKKSAKKTAKKAVKKTAKKG